MIKTTARFFFILLFVIGSLFTAPQVLAQSPSAYPPRATSNEPTSNPYTNPNVNPDVPKNLGTLTQSVVIEVMSAMLCQIIGINPTTSDQRCLGIDPQSGKIGFVPQGSGGAIGAMGSMIAVLYNPPLHTSDYTDYLASNFGIVKPAYAQQGIGLKGLTPLVGLWTAFRNITYLFMVLIFVVIGFAIMLRIKIDPRTVMSIENQVPKIIIALILITFSFALVGLMIDLMYVSIYVMFNVFSSIATGSTLDAIRQTQQTFNGGNPFGVMNELVGFGQIVTSAGGGVKDLVQSVFITSVSLDTANAPQVGIPLIGGIVHFFQAGFDVIRNGVGWVLGWLAGILALLVIAIAILVSMFRVWFALIKAYVLILIHTVLAPFWILGGLLPGSPVSFSGWIREMTSNFVAFPLTLGLFLLGKIFMEAFQGSGGQMFVPPLIGNPNANFGPIIGMGLVLLTPAALTIAKDLLKAPEFKYASEIGRGLGSGSEIVGDTLRQSSKAWFAARHGTYPSATERGWQAIQRQIFGGH